MADIKSKEVLLSELKTFIRSLNRKLDIGDNSLSKDLLLTPYSIGGEAIMDQVKIARDLHILSRLEGGDLDNEGTNYKLEKLTGGFSIVTLTFYSTIIPTADVIIPAGTQARTTGTSFVSAVTFSTVSESRFSVSDMSAYYSFDRDRYEFEVIAIADEVGTVGNVGSRLITNMLGSITGVEGVTNLTASVGGSDEEEDDDFRERIQLAKTGRDLNTVNGIRAFIKNAGFTDAYPVRPESEDAERQVGLDVFVISNASETVSQVFTYDPSKENYFLSNRPVLEVTAVVGSNKGTLSSSDYDEEIDSSSELRRSIYSTDHVRIRTAAALLAGEQVTVTYNYDSSINQTQGTMELNENNILTQSLLIKKAYPLTLNIVATLTLKANADGAVTRNKVKNALAQYISTYRLGVDIQKSDLIVVMQEGYGDYSVDTVDAVVITSYTLTDIYNNVRQPVDEIISVGNKEYVIYGSTTVT